MCRFMSAIVMGNGDILCDPEHTDSHEDLLLANGIRDGYAQAGGFARIEFVPGDDHDIASLPDWTLVMYVDNVPNWFDHAAVRAKMEAIVRRMLVDTARTIILGGCWILLDGAKVDRMIGGRVVAMRGSASIRSVRGSASISDVRGGASISDVGGGASISDVGGNASIRGVWGNASISDDHRLHNL